MLEHLDRNNTIKLTSGDIKIVDVTCYDDKICDSALASFSVNILFLGLGVRDCGNFRAWKLRSVIKTEGSPATPKFKNLLTISELGTLGINSKHCRLSLVQSLIAVFVKA